MRTSASSLRRFQHHNGPGTQRLVPISRGSPADIEGRTRYRATVVHPADSPRLLIRGINNRKIGDTVQKGRLKGAPIFMLTLEERATCPRSCHHWLSCYGNQMNWSRRHRHGPDLERRLGPELAGKQRRHPDGFLVRLHVLGDFYCTRYVECWRAWLSEFPALHIFAFTAWAPETEIGRALVAMASRFQDRCTVRHSSPRIESAPTALLIGRASSHRHGLTVVCPEQLGRTACCATCGLCWNSRRDIAFVDH